ncbi:unnamed protein product [Cylindrotheca closterium]|uniref:DEP domain-containing protein n=1 Tax=Cylindrotheca closterium TaxID=2856 RepID=A0AAD2JKH7_9STRA|nr:unnamed protein product [Cylindrotheca closterium]
MLNRSPSDGSVDSGSSTSTALKLTKVGSHIKLETMDGSHHSLNDWKPQKPRRSVSSNDEVGFFGEDFAITYDDESSISVSEDGSFAMSENDCSVAVSEITEPSMWASFGSSSWNQSKSQDSVSLIYGTDAVEYIFDAENDKERETEARPLHDEFRSNDLPPVPVRRNLSSKEGQLVDKFTSGSTCDDGNCGPPRPPRRQSTSDLRPLGENGLSQTRRSSSSDLISLSSRSSNPSHLPIEHSTLNTPFLGGDGSIRTKWSSMSNLPLAAQTVSSRNNRCALSSLPQKSSNLQALLPCKPLRSDGLLEEEEIEISKICSRLKFASESDPSISSNAPPQSPRRSSYSSNVSKKSASVPEPNTLMNRARTFSSLCAVSTHSKRLKKYPNTFVGSEAIDLMLKHGLARTREDAVFLGHRFCKEYNLFHHVSFDHTFKDGNYFYRFTNGVKEDLSILPYTSLEELRTLGEKFSQSMGVTKHISLMKTYKKTFMGNRAVDHMIAKGYASTRIHAVFIGQRLLEELNLFRHVSDQCQFKDSSHLYRFVSEDNTDRPSLESKEAELASVMSSIRSRRRLSFNGSERTSSTRTTVPPPPTTGSPNNKRSMRVSFGNVYQRHFERCLECNPATTKGPSLGLGWGFYDVPPVSVDDSHMVQKSRYGFRVSRLCREFILETEWGYTKTDIRRATRANEKIRQNRKKSFNKVSVVRSFVA